MRKWILIILSLALLSCQGSSFNAVNERLKAELVYEEVGEELMLKSMSLLFSVNLSADGDYSLQLISPDGKLKWDSPLSLDSGVYTSQVLAITEGALFPKGEYIYSILNNKGFEITGAVSLDYDEPAQNSSYVDGFGNNFVI